MESELPFNVTILAPEGLRGIEPYMHMCKLPVEAWTSSFKEIVILVTSGSTDEDFEFQMAHPTRSEMFGSGFLTISVEKSFSQLLSLSQALSAGNFPHIIGLDSDSRQITISYRCDTSSRKWLGNDGKTPIDANSLATTNQTRSKRGSKSSKFLLAFLWLLFVGIITFLLIQFVA